MHFCLGKSSATLNACALPGRAIQRSAINAQPLEKLKSSIFRFPTTLCLQVLVDRLGGCVVPAGGAALLLFRASAARVPIRVCRSHRAPLGILAGNAWLDQLRFRADTRREALRVTNLCAIPSKSRNVSGVTRDKRTSTAL
jgi:hypothetical protein